MSIAKSLPNKDFSIKQRVPTHQQIFRRLVYPERSRRVPRFSDNKKARQAAPQFCTLHFAICIFRLFPIGQQLGLWTQG